ncbi:hypothetical protein [Photobacterium sp.]|uniref:hypothetical protein n=1 Tax=Photobacterium sp. TaxID=660 RepID=UPI00299F35FE|nr:hypothetical protein [Photobacterium sp.]MDX1301701.1 hypothetical protein [Photobacterium sp.]
MNYVILLFGILILFSGLLIIIKPAYIFDFIRSHSESVSLHIFAVIIRLILGVALLTYAAESKYPFILEIIGWLSVSAAIIFAAIGRSRFTRLITWVLSFTLPFSRLGGIVAAFFGCFLIYAVI